MPYSYTNRHGKIHFFRAVETKSGKFRYYVTTSDEYPNLIEEVPRGFEVVEHPHDAKVVIRKEKPILTTYEEKEIVYDAINEFAGVNDFFIHAEVDYLSVYHSQFNYTAGIDENLTREEAIEIYGKEIERWMKFYSALRFRLVDQEKRLFQTERVVYTGYHGHTFNPCGKIAPIEKVAVEFGQHLGKKTFFEIEPNDPGEFYVFTLE